MFANEKHQDAYNLSTKKEFSSALILFNEALTISPDHPDIYGDRAVVFLHLNDEKKAFEDLNRAIELQPDYSYRYAARAYAHDYFGNILAAISDYERAVELDPNDSVAYNNLGLVQEKLGYKQKAEENFKRADKLAKQEQKLHELIRELEENDSKEPSLKSLENINVKDNRVLPPLHSTKKKDVFSEFLKLFTSKEQFYAFLKFLKNGLRIK